MRIELRQEYPPEIAPVIEQLYAQLRRAHSEILDKAGWTYLSPEILTDRLVRYDQETAEIRSMINDLEKQFGRTVMVLVRD